MQARHYSLHYVHTAVAAYSNTLVAQQQLLLWLVKLYYTAVGLRFNRQLQPSAPPASRLCLAVVQSKGA